MTACDQCRQAKKKCIFLPNSTSCTRCLRVGNICHPRHHRRNQSLPCLASSPTNSDGVLGGDDNPDVNGGRIRTGSNCMPACHAPLSGAHPQILPIHRNPINLQPSIHPSVEISTNCDWFNGGDDSHVVNDWRTRSERMAVSHTTLATDFAKLRPISGSHPQNLPIHRNRFNQQPSIPPSVDNSTITERVHGGDDSHVVNDWRTRSERMAASHSTLAGEFSKSRPIYGTYPKILPIHPSRINQQPSIPPSVETSTTCHRVHGGEDSHVVNDWRTRSERMAASLPTLAVDFSKSRPINHRPITSRPSITTSISTVTPSAGVIPTSSTIPHLGSTSKASLIHHSPINHRLATPLSVTTVSSSDFVDGGDVGHVVNDCRTRCERRAAFSLPSGCVLSTTHTINHRPINNHHSIPPTYDPHTCAHHNGYVQRMDEKRTHFFLHRWIPPPSSNCHIPQQSSQRQRRSPVNSSIAHVDHPPHDDYPPPWHIYKSDANSSKRTRAAHFAHDVKERTRSKIATSVSRKRASKKRKKQDEQLLNVCLPTPLHHLAVDRSVIASNTIVIDGGGDNNEQLSPPSFDDYDFPWLCLRIQNGDLHIVDTHNPDIGLCHSVPAGCHRAFLRLPRTVSLSISRMESVEETSRFITCLDQLEAVQQSTIARGSRRMIYSDYKYCCVGQQPSRSKRGVHPTYHHDKVSRDAYRHIVDVMKRYESAYFAFCDTNEIRRITTARLAVPFPTMGMELAGHHIGEMPIPHADCCEVFGAMAFGKNLHLRCHVDDDFTHSIVAVHVGGLKYQRNDAIVVYFCFPRLGLAVPLRPGDALIFNPREEHAISSRCDNSVKVYTISFYLKTSVVGLNDNKLKMTRDQEIVLNEFG